MTDLYETCREANRFIAAIAFLWLIYRSVRAWPAEWAKPDHVWHYRMLLALGSGFLGAATWGAYWHTTVDAPATGVSVLALCLSILTLAICGWWPKPRSMRKDRR